jgi:hypothetical protein
MWMKIASLALVTGAGLAGLAHLLGLEGMWYWPVLAGAVVGGGGVALLNKRRSKRSALTDGHMPR